MLWIPKVSNHNYIFKYVNYLKFYIHEIFENIKISKKVAIYSQVNI